MSQSSNLGMYHNIVMIWLVPHFTQFSLGWDQLPVAMKGPEGLFLTKLAVSLSKMVRFSIRNHRWKLRTSTIISQKHGVRLLEQVVRLLEQVR